MGILLLLISPTIGGLLQLALSRAREFGADLGAAVLTGDPDGLISALAKLEKIQGRHWEGLMLPGARIPEPSLLRTHPKTEDRIAKLRALHKESDYQKSSREERERASLYRPSTHSGSRNTQSPYAQRYVHLQNYVDDNPLQQIKIITGSEIVASKETINKPLGRPRIRNKKRWSLVVGKSAQSSRNGFFLWFLVIERSLF